MSATPGHRQWILVIAVLAIIVLFLYRYELAPRSGQPSSPASQVARDDGGAPPAAELDTAEQAVEGAEDKAPGIAQSIEASPYPGPAQRIEQLPTAGDSRYPGPESESRGTDEEAPPADSPGTAEPSGTPDPGDDLVPTSIPVPTATVVPTSAPTAVPALTATPRPTWTQVPPTPTRIVPTRAYPAQATATLVAQGAGDRRSNIGPYLLANPEAGQPTHNLLRTGNMRAYIAINPAHWGSRDRLFNMEGYGRNWIPADQELVMIRQGAEGGRRYYDKFKNTYFDTRDEIHAWMSTWAFVYGDDAFARQWVEFQREWLRLMHQEGFRAGVGGMRTHMFRSGEINWLASAIADSDYLYLSEADAPTLMYGRGDSTFRYRQLVQELRQVLGTDGVPEVILDVAVDGKVLDDLNRSGADWKRGYLHYGTTKESYMTDVRAYDRETLRDPYVRHVFWFATNYNSKENESFDVDTDMLIVANRWHVE